MRLNAICLILYLLLIDIQAQASRETCPFYGEFQQRFIRSEHFHPGPPLDSKIFIDSKGQTWLQSNLVSNHYDDEDSHLAFAYYLTPRLLSEDQVKHWNTVDFETWKPHGICVYQLVRPFSTLEFLEAYFENAWWARRSYPHYNKVATVSLIGPINSDVQLDRECSICCEDVFVDFYRSHCRHISHKKCLDSWSHKCRSTQAPPTCPTCRQALP